MIVKASGDLFHNATTTTHHDPPPVDLGAAATLYNVVMAKELYQKPKQDAL